MKTLITAILLISTVWVKAQNVVIAESESEADPSALLDVQSTSKGMLLPRLTEQQRTLIESPATGLLVYQSDAIEGFYFFDGTKWVLLLSGEEEDPVFTESVAADVANLGSGSIITSVEREKLEALNAEAQAPVGTIMAFAGESSAVSSGWLLCDGTAYSRSDYGALFAIIGEYWGEGDGNTSFNVPDLRGMFLRGADMGTSNDPDTDTRTGGSDNEMIGSRQEDAFQGHAHNAVYRNSNGGGTSNDYGIKSGNLEKTDGTLGVGDVLEYGAYGTPRATTETRPANVYVNYIIKY